MTKQVAYMVDTLQAYLEALEIEEQKMETEYKRHRREMKQMKTFLRIRLTAIRHSRHSKADH